MSQLFGRGPFGCKACTAALPQGIKEGAKLPPPLTVDPDELSEEERRELGVGLLPATLDEAYATLEQDAGEKGCFRALLMLHVRALCIRGRSPLPAMPTTSPLQCPCADAAGEHACCVQPCGRPWTRGLAASSCRPSWQCTRASWSGRGP